MEHTDSCNGDCCEAFCLNLSTDEIWRAYDAWFEGKKVWVTDDGKKLKPMTDIHLVAPMLRSLGKHLVNPVSGDTFNYPRELYTCTHFDRETRRCAIYEHRPHMCREYPGHKRCEYPGCTWKRESGTKEG